MTQVPSVAADSIVETSGEIAEDHSWGSHDHMNAENSERHPVRTLSSRERHTPVKEKVGRATDIFADWQSRQPAYGRPRGYTSAGRASVLAVGPTPEGCFVGNGRRGLQNFVTATISW